MLIWIELIECNRVYIYIIYMYIYIPIPFLSGSIYNKTKISVIYNTLTPSCEYIQDNK